MTLAYLGLGGNLGTPLVTLSLTVKAIGALPEVLTWRVSPFYKTAPVSPIPQPPYLNGVMAVEVTCTAEVLLDRLQHIERSLGKVAKPKEAPRLIDIDILLFGEERIATPTLEVPHPRMFERSFVLIPLATLADTVVLPGGERVALQPLIVPYGEETVDLRREVGGGKEIGLEAK